MYYIYMYNIYMYNIYMWSKDILYNHPGKTGWCLLGHSGKVGKNDAVCCHKSSWRYHQQNGVKSWEYHQS